jgi:hypothetical protein
MAAEDSAPLLDDSSGAGNATGYTPDEPPVAVQQGIDLGGDKEGTSSPADELVEVVPQASSTLEEGFLRFEFGQADKLLGLRLSPDVPPAVIAIKPGSAGASKGVPVNGTIQMINGLPLKTIEDKQAIGDLLSALKVRPLVLLVSDPTAPVKKVEAAKVEAANDPAGPGAPSGPPDGDDESDGDSSASETKHDDRAASDLALLAQASVKPTRGSPKSANFNSNSPGSGSGAKADAKAPSEDSGEDSGVESQEDVSADRFDRDMGLLHKAAQRAPAVAESTSPGGTCAGQVEDDEALARRLQAELDAEEEVSGAGSPNIERHSGHSDVGEDEQLARMLQAEYDIEAEAIEAQSQKSPPKAAQSSKPTVATPPSSPSKSSKPVDVNPFGNLLGEPVSKLHDESIWTLRQRKIATFGTSCMKVGRNGKSYKRTFWMSEGFLWTDGKGTRHIPVAELTGVYRGNNSEEFEKLKGAKGGLLRRSISREGSTVRDNPHICCVLTTSDRTFSLYFPSTDRCDEFVETIAWYAQRLTWA